MTSVRLFHKKVCYLHSNGYNACQTAYIYKAIGLDGTRMY